MFDLSALFSLTKNGKINAAKTLIKITDNQLNDALFIEYVISLENFINLFISGRQPEAFQYISNIDKLLSFSNDDSLKFFLNTLLNFSEGLRRLLAGDVWKAASLFDDGSKDIERMSFFIPEFKKFGLTYKALAKIAIVRIHINAGNIESAENISGEVNEIYDEMLKTLDIKKESDMSGFAEVFASKLELTIFFTTYDYLVYDFDSMKNRLDKARVYKEELLKYTNKIQDGPIKSLFFASIKIHSVYEIFYDLSKKIIISREPFNKKDNKKLINVGKFLLDAKDLSVNSGIRGQGYLAMINQLISIHKNLCLAGKISKKDFGRFSGTISVLAFTLLFVMIQIFIKPSEQLQVVYLVSEIMLSLIVGFGYGALKFQPLLKLLSGNNKE